MFSLFFAVSRGEFLFMVRKIIIITVNRNEFSMKYKDWLDVWFANYIEPSSKTKTCERYSEIIEKYLKVKLGEYELEELSPIVRHTEVYHRTYAFGQSDKRKGGSG